MRRERWEKKIGKLGDELTLPNLRVFLLHKLLKLKGANGFMALT